jgi:hypothetical protein
MVSLASDSANEVALTADVEQVRHCATGTSFVNEIRNGFRSKIEILGISHRSAIAPKFVEQEPAYFPANRPQCARVAETRDALGAKEVTIHSSGFR